MSPVEVGTKKRTREGSRSHPRAYEEGRSARTMTDTQRRTKALRVATALAIAVAALAGGCPSASESLKVAERFMTLYYGDANAAQAVALCTGEAERKLRHEIAAIQGVASDTGADRPTVTWSLISHSDPDPRTRTYVYKVVAHTSDVGSLTSTLIMVQRNNRWLVSSLKEEHSLDKG
jgi:hypothetical protein